MADKPVWGIPEIEAWFETSFPQVARGKGLLVTEEVTTRTSRVVSCSMKRTFGREVPCRARP